MLALFPTWPDTTPECPSQYSVGHACQTESIGLRLTESSDKTSNEHNHHTRATQADEAYPGPLPPPSSGLRPRFACSRAKADHAKRL